jgi:hypothetical protein
MSIYPEHDKLDRIKVLSQAQAEFIEWLEEEKDISLCTWDDDDEGSGFRIRSRTPIQQLLAEYHHIDLKKLELEKRQMLEELRRA